MGVAKAAGELGVPTVAICGSFGEGYAETAKDHFLAVLSLEEIAGSKEEAMRHPKELLKEALRRLLASCPLPVVARPRVLRKEGFDAMTGLTG